MPLDKYIQNMTMRFISDLQFDVSIFTYMIQRDISERISALTLHDRDKRINCTIFNNHNTHIHGRSKIHLQQQYSLAWNAVFFIIKDKVFL